MPYSSHQKNIKGDMVTVVGRDQHISLQAAASVMAKLNANFSIEQKNSESSDDIIDRLQHYMNNIDQKPLRDLEAKLSESGRQTSIADALEKKEHVAKIITQHSTSISAQKIFTYVLGEIYERFQTYIYPLIQENRERRDVDKAIFELVLKPSLECLEENVMDLFHKEIWGLVYYLTGNCHIEWS